MATNIQSIPEISPSTTHEIDPPDRQRTLPVGPTGRVHRSTLPDNRAFWESVNAVEFSSRGVTRQQVFRAVAWFASMTDARVCFASVATLAKKARLGTTATRAHLRALERDAYIETDGGRSGGRAGTRYRLSTQRVSVPNPTLSVAQPNAQRCVNPTLSVAEEVIEEGIEEVQAAPLPVQKTGQKGPRHECVCGNTWPESFGPVCFQCKCKVGEFHRAGLARPTFGKYDALFDDDAPKPDPTPLTPDAVARLETDAVLNGYRQRDGRWTRAW